MTEKRRHPRLKINLPVILRYKGLLLPATMLNLSCGGMCLRADDPEILKNAPVEVIFDLDDKKRDISLQGRITHTEADDESTQVGIELVNVVSEGFKEIQEYLGKHLN